MGKNSILKGNEGVSEVLGTVLLMAIMIIAFSTISVVIFGMLPDEERCPHTKLGMHIEDGRYVDTIVITHLRGDALYGEETKIVIYDGNDLHEEIFPVDFTDVGDEDDYFEIGEEWKHEIRCEDVFVKVVDVNSREIISELI
jgi:hypothetical protein